MVYYKRGEIIIGIDNCTDPIVDHIIEEKNGDNVAVDHDASSMIVYSFSPITAVMFDDAGGGGGGEGEGEEGEGEGE